MSDTTPFGVRDMLRGVIDNALGLAALATLIITNIGVLCRYVFAIPMPWNEEIVRFLFIWMIFLGFAQSYRAGGLAGITFLEESLMARSHSRSYTCIKLFQGLIGIAFGAYCVYAAWDIMQFQFETGEITVVLEIPLYLITLGVITGFVLFTSYAVNDFVKLLRRNPEQAKR